MKTRIAAIAAAAVLVIGGGTAYALSTNATDAEGPALIEATTTSTPSPSATESEAPLAAESPKAEAGDDAESEFLTDVRARLAKIQTQIPNASDEQLLDVGRESCELTTEEISSEVWSGIEGEQRTYGYFMDSGIISTSARLHLCPEKL